MLRRIIFMRHTVERENMPRRFMAVFSVFRAFSTAYCSAGLPSEILSWFHTQPIFNSPSTRELPLPPKGHGFLVHRAWLADHVRNLVQVSGKICRGHVLPRLRIPKLHQYF